MANTQLPPDFKDFLNLLNKNDVRYLLIGGYAVGYHGYPRATADMDVWISAGPDEKKKAACRLTRRLNPGMGNARFKPSDQGVQTGVW